MSEVPNSSLPGLPTGGAPSEGSVAATVVVTPVETKPAPKTTEFWITLAILVLGFAQQLLDLVNISDARVALLQTIVASAYALARGLAKNGVQGMTTTTVEPDQTVPEHNAP